MISNKETIKMQAAQELLEARKERGLNRSENVEKTLSAEANTISDNGSFGLPKVYSG
jgi:post-segregation antitoxin (ccd killing protein)